MSEVLPLAMLPYSQFWYLLPLLVTISLVYGATRHELLGPILHNAYQSGVWMLGFMLSIFAVLVVVDWLFI